MPPVQPDDNGLSVEIAILKMGDHPSSSYRIESDCEALVNLQARSYRTLSSAQRAAMRIGRRYRNGAVVFICSADGERVRSAVFRPLRALWQAVSETFITYFEAAVFFSAAIFSGAYFWRWGDVYEQNSTDLTGQLQTAMGLAVVAVAILASVGVTATFRIALDHKKSWTLRRDVIARSVMLAASALFVLPALVFAYFVNNEFLMVIMVSALSGLLSLLIVGTVRILTSFYCYAVDVAEQA